MPVPARRERPGGVHSDRCTSSVGTQAAPDRDSFWRLTPVRARQAMHHSNSIPYTSHPRPRMPNWRVQHGGVSKLPSSLLSAFQGRIHARL